MPDSTLEYSRPCVVDAGDVRAVTGGNSGKISDRGAGYRGSDVAERFDGPPLALPGRDGG